MEASLSWLEDTSVIRSCALQGFRVNCRGRLTLHHLVSRGDARGNDEVNALLDCHPPELTEFICEAHHTHERWGDTKEGQRILWRRKADEFGEDWMRFVLASLPWKVARPEMQWDSLTG